MYRKLIPLLSILILFGGLYCTQNIIHEKPAKDAVGAVFFPGENLRVEMIQPGVYLVTHSFPWPANSLIVNLGQKGFCMVDTPYTPGATVQIIDWMKRKFLRLPVLAINTGFHVDNLGGNQALSFAGIPVYGTRLTGSLTRSQGAPSLKKLLPFLKGEENMKYRKVFEALTLMGPDRQIIIDSEGRGRLLKGAIDVFYPGPTHTKDNLVVFFPSKNLLFGGCMVLAAAAQSPGNSSDADMKKWPWNVEKVLQRYAGAGKVIPGHGAPGDVSLLRHTIDVLHRLRRGR